MIFIYVILALLLIIVAISYWAYCQAFYNPQKDRKALLPTGDKYEPFYKKMKDLIDEMEPIPYEQVFIKAKDGAMLAGRYYHVADGAPLEIQLHGYKGEAVRDFCGGNSITRKCGRNSLVIDQRAHGRSGSRTITFGIKERYDCLSWVEYACERFGYDTNIILSGVSMGAATVLMASGLDLPRNVRCIVADCPYNSPVDIIKKVCGERGYPKGITFPFIALGAFLFGGFNIFAATAAESVTKSDIPILLIHGEDDTFVPAYMSREIFEACKDHARYETFPEAAHGMSYINDTERYEKLVTEFVSDVLKSD